MLKNKISDKSILFDLEYRGLDSAISDFNSGLSVPKNMFPQIKKIIKNNYDIDMEIIQESTEKKNGCFCLVEYEDEVICLIKAKRY